LLPRPALADDQDRTRDLRDAPDRVLERLHGGARAHERGLGIEAAPQGGELPREALLLERVLDLLHDAFHRLGLVDEAPGSEPDGLRAAVVVARPGVDEHRHPEPTSLHGPQHFEAVHPRHFQVEDDAVHRLALQQIERRAARERDEHVVAAYALQVVRVLLRHGGYVVHDQDGAHHVSPGSSTMNALPAPGSVSTRNAPLASSTRRRTIERPRPVPPGSVAYETSKAGSSAACALPLPVSATVMRTPPCPFAAVETVTWPARAARLSRAFPMRFSRMRRRTRASVRAGRRPSASSSRSSAGPVSLTRLMVSRTTAFTSHDSPAGWG